MTDPSSVQSPPSPFQPRPPGRGCSKPVLLGCGALVVLLGICVIALLLKLKDIERWYFHKVEAQITSQLPPDLPPAERERLHAAFANLDRGLANGKLDPAGLQPLQAQLSRLVGKPNRQLSREDVEGLTAALERLAGKAPVPSPPPSP